MTVIHAFIEKSKVFFLNESCGFYDDLLDRLLRFSKFFDVTITNVDINKKITIIENVFSNQ